MKKGYGRNKTTVNAGTAQEKGNTFAKAVQELKSQHPHDYCEHGPFHDSTAHIRHKPTNVKDLA